MALTKQDLDAINGIVGKVDSKVDNLALAVADGFKAVDERFDRVETELHSIRWDLSDTVRRGEFLDLRDRVEKLERESS
jgi:hypothetical protein